MINSKILDNPAWHALQTVHSNFATGTATIKRYPANVLRGLACEDAGSAILKDIEPWVSPAEKFFMIGDLAPLPASWSVYVKLDCIQMICPKVIMPFSKINAEIIPLTEADHDKMLELVNLVMPGYYHKNTPLLGNYWGIKQDNKLVAMAGERLKITGFTEVSAVVTDPEFTGKGFAQQLVAHVAAKNLDDGCLPFLHFAAGNERARRVYELLGFTETRPIPFWGIMMDC